MIIVKVRIKLILLICIIVILSACTVAPVQEMSDARMAIRSAEEAGAALYSPVQLSEARQLLNQAQNNLERGSYSAAKHYALGARDQAIRAREQASAHLP